VYGSLPREFLRECFVSNSVLYFESAMQIVDALRLRTKLLECKQSDWCLVIWFASHPKKYFLRMRARFKIELAFVLNFTCFDMLVHAMSEP